MLIAILDTETTGLDLKEAKILEVAIVIYCTINQRVITTRSLLINYPNLYVSKEITDINGITAKMCEDYGCSLDEAMWITRSLLSKCDCVIAHNGSAYDYLLLERHVDIPVPKLDSKTDIKWPYQSKRLIHLVAEMGCQVMPAHTAMSDCLMLLDVLKKANKWDELASIVEHRKQKVMLDGLRD